MPSNVVMVADSPKVKLPFIHSKFKPRSKFAKTYNNGFNRSTKLRSSQEDECATTTKLPQIMYNGGDCRTLITFGKHGTRREYPGFTGHAKIQKRRSSVTKSNWSSRSMTSLDISDSDSMVWMKSSDKGGAKGSESARSFCRDSPGRLIIKSRRSMCESESKDSLPDLNSLIIVEDEESGQTRPNSVNDSARRVYFGKDVPVPNEDEIVESDPFARHVETKLKDSRDLVGMKKDRTKRSDPYHPRPLGDVMTSERFTELLSIKSQALPLKFS